MRLTIEFILLITLIAASGCAGWKNSCPAPLPGARADSFVSEARPFEIGSEKYDADFGMVTVPENRSKSTSRLINTPFLRIHSHSRNPAEPIFGFTGGPGASNMSWDWAKARTFLPDRDFVLVGCRGVDGSTVPDGFYREMGFPDGSKNSARSNCFRRNSFGCTNNLARKNV